MKRMNKKGFTIVELMIATTIFSGILLMMIMAYLYMSKAFVHAYIQAQTQTAARNVITSVSQSLSLSGGEVRKLTPTTGPVFEAYCIGNDEYSYTINDPINNSPTPTNNFSPDNPSLPFHMNNTHCQDAPDTSSSQGIIVGNGIYIKDFSISPIATGSSIVKINIQLYYGAGGQLVTPNFNCPGLDSGGEFCSTASYSTYVNINNGVF